MKYAKAKEEVVLFDNSDIITTSNCRDGVHVNLTDTRPCESESHMNGVPGCDYTLQWS